MFHRDNTVIPLACLSRHYTRGDASRFTSESRQLAVTVIALRELRGRISIVDIILRNRIAQSEACIVTGINIEVLCTSALDIDRLRFATKIRYGFATEVNDNREIN